MNTLMAYENQDYPFGELIKRLGVGNDLSRNPLFDVMLNVLNQNRSQLEMEGVRVIPWDYAPPVSKVDVTVEALETGDRVVLEFEYCTALFKRETMERFSHHFVNTLNAVVHHPESRLCEIEILDREEKQQLLEVFNDTAVEYPENKPVQQLFEEQVSRTPHLIAVNDAHQQVTYKKLNQTSNQLARFLKNKGVKPDTMIGIMMDRSPRLIIGFGHIEVGCRLFAVGYRIPRRAYRIYVERQPYHYPVDREKMAR